MIPTPVISRFLKDIGNGRYDEYPDLAITYVKLQNPAQRKYLGLKDDDRGVLVGSVVAAGPSNGILKSGDVLLSIDGHPIASDANVEIDGERSQFEEVVERKFKGDSVKLEILREKQPMTVTLKLFKPWPYSIQGHSYDVRPRYVLYGGLLFQPLNLDMAAERRSSVMVHVVLDERDAIFRTESDERRLQEIVTSELVCNEIMQMQAFRRCVLDMSHVEIKSAAVQQETAIAWRILVVAVVQIDRAGVSFAKQIVLNLGRPKLGIYVRLVFAEKTTVLGFNSNDSIHSNQITRRMATWLSEKDVPSALSIPTAGTVGRAHRLPGQPGQSPWSVARRRTSRIPGLSMRSRRRARCVLSEFSSTASTRIESMARRPIALR